MGLQFIYFISFLRGITLVLFFLHDLRIKSYRGPFVALIVFLWFFIYLTGQLGLSIKLALFEDFISSNQSGFISSMDTFEIGMASITLGCGRIKTTDIVDPTAGIEFLKKTGEEVQNGEAIIRCFNSSLSKLQETLKRLDSVIQCSDIPKTHTLIH